MINRRNFFKVVTGFIGGVYAAFVPKVESTEDILDKALVTPKVKWFSLGKPKKRSGYIYYELYDFKTNTQVVFENDKIIDERTYDQCPFVLFGQTEEKVKSGEITFLVQKKTRFV